MAAVTAKWFSFLFVLTLIRQTLGQVPPQISPFKVLEDLSEGKRVALVCSVSSGTRPILFQWLKEGQTIENLPNVYTGQTGEYQASLQIENLSADHVGNYTCSAKNAYGSDQMSVAVVLNFKPRWINNEPESKNAVAGNILKIDCRAIGRPQPVIKIIKGKLIHLTLVHFLLNLL